MMIDCNNLLKYPGGEVQYSFRMFAAYDHPIRCIVEDSRVIECVFNKVDVSDQFDPIWQLRIRLGPVLSIEEVDQISDEVKDKIFDRLSFVLNIKIDQIRKIGHSLIPMSGGGGLAYLIGPMATLSASGRAGCRKLLADDVEALQAAIAEDFNHSNKPLVALYLSALAADDPVVKFLIFYLIIYDMCGNDKQKPVDERIREIAPETIGSEHSWVDGKSVSRSIQETIYTRLRNEISHRVKAKPEETRAEIISNLDAFQKIVYLALCKP